MRSVGIRELRQNASALVRAVERGETLQLTDRGRPVAIIAPLAADGPLERLRALGETVEPARSIDDLPPPIEPVRGKLPSNVLLRLRRHER